MNILPLHPFFNRLWATDAYALVRAGSKGIGTFGLADCRPRYCNAQVTLQRRACTVSVTDVQQTFNARFPDDCLTLLSRWLVNIPNSLKHSNKPHQNLQASCKHGASNANAFRKQCERTNRSRTVHEPCSDSFLKSDTDRIATDSRTPQSPRLKYVNRSLSLSFISRYILGFFHG